MINLLGEPPFSIADQNLEPGPHSLTIFASTPGGQVQEIGLGIDIPGEYSTLCTYLHCNLLYNIGTHTMLMFNTRMYIYRN